VKQAKSAAPGSMLCCIGCFNCRLSDFVQEVRGHICPVLPRNCIQFCIHPNLLVEINIFKRFENLSLQMGLKIHEPQTAVSKGKQ